MPVLSFMLLISSRFENMWVPLGIGVAGFLSGMALANSGLTLLLAVSYTHLVLLFDEFVFEFWFRLEPSISLKGGYFRIKIGRASCRERV